MKAQLPEFIETFGLMINGIDLRLKADELQLPKMTPVKIDYKAGGIKSTIKVHTGTYEPMEFSAKIAGLEHALLTAKDMCSIDGTILVLVGKGKKVGTCETVNIEIEMHGSAKDWDMGQLKSGEQNATQAPYDISYYYLKVDGKSIIERDDLRGLFKINGKSI